jgi:acyl-CoA synthetase (AMP-forming)/AMP-acid ligase II
VTRIARLLDRISARGGATCLVHAGRAVSGAGLADRVRAWNRRLDEQGIGRGRVVGLAADFSVDAVALHLALLSRGCVTALLPRHGAADSRALRDCGATGVFEEQNGGELAFRPCREPAEHDLVRKLCERGGAGFVLFSSGSTGRPKAILHDVERFLGKFDREGRSLRTLAFLLFDHIAGQDTMFYTLWHGGELVLPERRNPDHVARLIEAHRVQVLPASPTFLNLFCLAHSQEGRDLSSLEVITYGSEPMPPETLARVGRAFPGVDLVQKYGTSELGSPRSKTRSPHELWMRLDGLSTKVVDGVLWIRSDQAMLGYLNAPNPFDGDGWYCTGDLVEQDGEWIRFLGRASDVINVGGEKVFPQEVESVIHELAEIDDVLVRGAHHPLTGQVVEAIVRLRAAREEREVRKLVRSHCRERLPNYKVPVKVLVTQEPLSTERHKKVRRAQGTPEAAADAGST